MRAFPARVAQVGAGLPRSAVRVAARLLVERFEVMATMLSGSLRPPLLLLLRACGATNTMAVGRRSEHLSTRSITMRRPCTRESGLAVSRPAVPAGEEERGALVGRRVRVG